MSREMLSQEEIDALLRQSQSGSDHETEDVNQYLSPFDQDALGEIGNISFGSASTALSTLLGQKVEITTPTIMAVQKKDLEKKFPSPHVSVHVEYTQGFKGFNLFVIKSTDAKIIADLMMGGTGRDIAGTELTEMDISAVQEAMNQMMGSAATSMSTIFNTMVNISPPGVDILDIGHGQGEEALPDEEILIMVSFRLKIGDLIDSNIMQITTVSFARKMIEKLLGEEQQEPVSNTGTHSNQGSVKEEHTAKTNEQKSSNYPETVSYEQPGYSPAPSKQIASNVNVQPAQFADFGNGVHVKNHDPNLGLLLDIPLQITVELGRTKKLIKDILELSQGSIIELDKLAGEPVDIFANNKLIAKGEVVVIDENFGVRVTDIISQYERVKKLQ